MEPVIKIRFVRIRSLASLVIGWREGSCMPFVPSHAEFVLADGTMWVGEHGFGGMQARLAGYDRDQVEIMPDGRRCEIIVSLPVTQDQADKFYTEGMAACGEGYDWSSIAGFILPGHHHQQFHATCSAKIFLLLRACGYFRWPVVVPAHLINPRDLLLILSTHVEIPH